MEKEKVKASELEVGIRYRYINIPSQWFTVTKMENDSIWVKFNDGVLGLYYSSDLVKVIEFPLSALEKELL